MLQLVEVLLHWLHLALLLLPLPRYVVLEQLLPDCFSQKSQPGAAALHTE